MSLIVQRPPLSSFAWLAHVANRRTFRVSYLTVVVACFWMTPGSARACLSSVNDYNNADLSGHSCPGSVYVGGQHDAFRSANLNDANFSRSRINIKGIGFENASLINTDLSRTSITGQSLMFQTANLTNANLSGAVISINGNTPFSGARLAYANLSRARFSFTSTAALAFNNADFSNANASNAEFKGESTGFSSSTLKDADFSNALFNFDYPVFSNADLTNANFSNISLQGDGSAFRYADLTNSNFTGASIENTSVSLMRRANLTNANFSEAVIKGDSFSMREVDMTGANFSGATIESRFGLRDAVINNTNFSGANLSRVPLSQVLFEWTTPPLYDKHTIFPVGYDPSIRFWKLVPEPSSCLLLMLGMTGFLFCRRSR